MSSNTGLRYRATDGPGNFFTRDKHVRIATVWIYDVFAAFQVMKTAGLPDVTAAHSQQLINSLHHFARLHLLCAVAAETAKFIIRVPESRCHCAG